LDEKADEFG